MNRWALVVGLFSIGALVLGSASCSGRDRSFDQGPSGLVPTEAGVPEPPPSCEGLRCSRDLKHVVDGCTDEVVQECGADKGCANGACVDPCSAAEVAKGSAGCSFWTLPPDEPTYGPGSCFAAMIANTWDRPVTISADYGTTPLDLGQSLFTAEMIDKEPKYTKLEGPLPPGQVALVFLSEIRPTPPPSGGRQNFSACPVGVVGALNADPLIHGTAITKAFSIKTDAPVSAYSIYPYGGAKTYIPSATLLWPTSAWTTNYVAVSGWPQVRDHYDNPIGNPTLQIVATADDTEVRMRPKTDVYDGLGVVGGAAGKMVTWKLARGEVLQLTQPDELTGSPIESSKPIGVFGGAQCTYIPTAVSACDSLHQQIPPLQQWGSEYALVPYKGRFTGEIERREVVPYRLVGAVDGTVLSYDPAPPRDAPATLRAGEVAMFMSEQLVVVKSQDADHPFYASVNMTGALFNTGAMTDGDPDFVNIVPTDQFLDRYVFFADYTYPETRLTLVRRKSAKGFMPVEIDCLGEVTGFRPLGATGEFEFAWVDLTTGFTPASGTCLAGRHEAKSDGPFSVTVWGMGYCASYGYAGGAGSRALTQVEVPVR
jgi:IgGFc binding protein